MFLSPGLPTLDTPRSKERVHAQRPSAGVFFLSLPSHFTDTRMDTTGPGVHSPVPTTRGWNRGLLTLGPVSFLFPVSPRGW